MALDLLMKQYLIILIFALSIVACATTERFEKRYKTWIGLNKTELINALGKPQDIIEAIIETPPFLQSKTTSFIWSVFMMQLTSIM